MSDSEGSRDGARGLGSGDQRNPVKGRGSSRRSLASHDSWNLEPAVQATIPVKPHSYHSYVEDASLQALAARSATRYTLCTGVLISNIPSLAPAEYGARLDAILHASLPAISHGFDGHKDTHSFLLGSGGVGDTLSWVSLRKLRDVTIASNPLPVKSDRTAAVTVTFTHRVSAAGQESMSVLTMLSAEQYLWVESATPRPLLVCRCYARHEGDIDLVAQFLLRHFQKALSITKLLIVPSALIHTKAQPEIVFNVLIFDQSLIPSLRASIFPGLLGSSIEHPGCVHMTDMRFHYAPHEGIFFNQPYDPRLSARASDYPRLKKPLSPHGLPGGSRITYLKTDSFGLPHPQQVAQVLYNIPSTGPAIVQGILFLQRGAEGAPAGYKITWKSNGFIALIAAQIKRVLANISTALFVLDEPAGEDPFRPTLLLSLLTNVGNWRSLALPALDTPPSSAPLPPPGDINPASSSSASVAAFPLVLPQVATPSCAWEAEESLDEAHLLLDRIETLEGELANTAERLHSLRQDHALLLERTDRLELSQAQGADRLADLESRLLLLASPRASAVPPDDISVPPTGSASSAPLISPPLPTSVDNGTPLPSSPHAPPSATTATITSLGALVLSPSLNPENASLSHGPTLHDDKVGWRFSLRYPDGPFGVSIIVNPLEHPALPVFAGEDENILIPEWCVVKWYRCLSTPLPQHITPNPPLMAAGIPLWYTGEPSLFDAMALQSAFPLNDEYSFTPLSLEVLLGALQKLATMAHDLFPRVISAINGVGRAMPLASYALETTKSYEFEVSLFQLSPAAQVHVLTWLAPMEPSDSVWKGFLMEARALVTWRLAKPLHQIIHSPGSKRHKMGILLALLSLCSGIDPYPILKLTGQTSTRGPNGADVIKRMEAMFGGKGNHVPASVLNEFYVQIRNVPLTAIPSSPHWSDAKLLQTIPSRSITVRGASLPFPFPIWEAHASESTARLRWAPSMPEVGGPYTLGLLCRLFCAPTETLLMTSLPLDSDPNASRTVLPLVMPSHSEFLTQLQADLTSSLLETRRAVLRPLGNTQYGPDLFSPPPTIPPPSAP